MRGVLAVLSSRIIFLNFFRYNYCMDASLARLHARICGDGNVSKYKTSESDRDRRAEIMYTNYDEKNISEFRRDLNSNFDVRGTRYENQVRIKSIRIVEELEDRFGEFSSNGFVVPEDIKASSEEVKLSWLRAFIRDEGYFDHQNDRLRIKLMNKKALFDIKQLFSDVDVPSKITGPNSDESWYLTVSDIDNYSRILKFAKNKSKVK